MKSYELRRAERCRVAFDSFHPNFSRARNPETAALILEMAIAGKTSAQIGLAVGKTPKAVQKFFRRYGFPDLHNISPRIRDEQPMWKGGVKIVKGYAYKRCPDHPHRSKHGGYVAVHRLVAEQSLGRYLTAKEVVHHIDDNPANNAPSNLEVFPSNGDHLRATRAGKCPKWSSAGKESLDRARRQRRRTWKGRPISPTPDP